MQNYSDRGNSLVMPPPDLTLVIVSSYISLINFIYLIGTYLSKKKNLPHNLSMYFIICCFWVN